jgi:hypothetical protein
VASRAGDSESVTSGRIRRHGPWAMLHDSQQEWPGGGRARSRVGEAGDGCLVRGVTAAWADGDDLDRVGVGVVGSEPIDDPEPFGLVPGEVEAQAMAAAQVTTHVACAQRLASLASLCKVGDGLEAGVDQRVVDGGQSSKVVKDVREQGSVEGLCHDGRSAIAARISAKALGGFVERDPFRPGRLEPLAGFQGVESVLDCGEDLKPQLPGDDDTLGSTVAAKRDRFRGGAVAFKVRCDLGQLGPDLGSRQNLGWSSRCHGENAIQNLYVFTP